MSFMKQSIRFFTTGYLAPIKIIVQNEDQIYYDAFLYNINEQENMENIIDKIILDNDIFKLKNNVGKILKDNARQQIKHQVDIFKRVINHKKIVENDFKIKIHLEFNIKSRIFKDDLVFCSFSDYEPEIYSNDVCREYDIPIDSSKYMSFDIRTQIFAYQKNILENINQI